MTKVYSRRAGLAGASLLAMAFAPSAFAQSAETEDRSDIVVTATSATTATKTDTPILRIPQAIEVVSLEEIKERGALNIREALKYTSGVSNGSDDSRGDFNIIRGHESVLYVDGLKRNYGFVFMPRVDVNTLERVEVLIGPASVLYGSGSASGVTNMQTKRPQFEFGGSASISYGTFDRKEATADITGPLSETLAFRLVGVVRDSDSRMDYTPNDRVLGQAALTWKPTDRTDITAIGLYQHDKNPPNYNIVPLVGSLYALPGQRIPDSRFFGEPGINKGDKEYTALSLLATHSFSDALTFRSSNRYTWANTQQAEYYLATYFGSGPLDPFVPAGTTRVPRNLYAINVRYNVFNTDNSLAFKFDTGPASHQLLAGIDYSYFKNAYEQVFVSGIDTIDVYNPVYGTGAAPVFGATTTEVLKQTGFYLQDQIDFGEIASLVLGIRHDRYRRNETAKPEESTNKTTKRAGLTINATSKLAPYISYAESFLPIVGQNQLGQTYVPLSGKQKEIGVKWQPFRSTMLRVSLYDLKENNALRTDPLNPFLQTQTGSKKSRGVEFQANHNVQDDLSLIAAFSYSTAELSGQNYQAEGSPKYMASLFGTKTVQLANDVSMRLGGGVRYNGATTSRSGSFIVEAPSYTLVDALVAFDYKAWTLQLNAINLFDERYYPGCSVFGSCANGEPRTVQGTLSYRF
jgi:iron complex outermembrane receptor protein